MANLARFDPFGVTRMDPFESMVRDLYADNGSVHVAANERTDHRN